MPVRPSTHFYPLPEWPWMALAIFSLQTPATTFAKSLSTELITRVAGNGSPGYSGDGGPAINAQLDNPSGMAVDSTGNLFIADTRNQRIRKVSSDGIITTVAGNASCSSGYCAGGYSGDGGLASNAQLNYPTGVAVDRSGNLFVADSD